MEVSDYVIAYFIVQVIFTVLSVGLIPFFIDDPRVGRFYKRWYISFAFTTAGVLVFQPHQDTALALGIVFTVILMSFPSLKELIGIKNNLFTAKPKKVDHGYRLEKVHGQYVAMLPGSDLMGMGNTEKEAVHDLDRLRAEERLVELN